MYELNKLEQNSGLKEQQQNSERIFTKLVGFDFIGLTKGLMWRLSHIRKNSELRLLEKQSICFKFPVTNFHAIFGLWKIFSSNKLFSNKITNKNLSCNQSLKISQFLPSLCPSRTLNWEWSAFKIVNSSVIHGCTFKIPTKLTEMRARVIEILFPFSHSCRFLSMHGNAVTFRIHYLICHGKPQHTWPARILAFHFSFSKIIHRLSLSLTSFIFSFFSFFLFYFFISPSCRCQFFLYVFFF